MVDVDECVREHAVRKQRTQHSKVTQFAFESQGKRGKRQTRGQEGGQDREPCSQEAGWSAMIK